MHDWYQINDFPFVCEKIQLLFREPYHRHSPRNFTLLTSSTVVEVNFRHKLTAPEKQKYFRLVYICFSSKVVGKSLRLNAGKPNKNKLKEKTSDVKTKIIWAERRTLRTHSKMTSTKIGVGCGGRLCGKVRWGYQLVFMFFFLCSR